jgi:hypothetical protein
VVLFYGLLLLDLPIPSTLACKTHRWIGSNAVIEPGRRQLTTMMFAIEADSFLSKA